METTDVDKSPEGKDPKDPKNDEKNDAVSVKPEGADKGSGKGASGNLISLRRTKIAHKPMWKMVFFSCL